MTDPAATEHPAALTLGLAAPDAVIHSLFKGILQAGFRHRALGADALSCLYADTVARKENGGRQLSALSHAHPFRIHGPSIRLEEAAVGFK